MVKALGVRMASLARAGMNMNLGGKWMNMDMKSYTRPTSTRPISKLPHIYSVLFYINLKLICFARAKSALARA